MTGRRHGWLRTLAERWVGEDDWGLEFLDALDEKSRARYPGEPGLRAHLWYARRLVSPTAMTFYGQLRRRSKRRRVREGRVGMMDGILADVRTAARTLLRERRYAVFGSATLALGVAGVATMFGITDRLFLSGLPRLEEQDDLSRIYLVFDEDSGPRTSPWIPWLTYEAMRNGETGFSGFGAYRYETRAAELPTGPRRLEVSAVDAGYFEVLGARPALGRVPRPEDPGDATAALISHALWRSAFEADPGVLSERLTLAGVEFTIVGVAPEGFSGPGLERVDVWVSQDPEMVGNRNWWVVTRLASASGPRDAVRDAAAARANAIHERTDPGRFMQWAAEGRIEARPLGYDDAGEEPVEADVARLLFAVCLLVLLLACVNVVNLTLARMIRRTCEIVVRRALGAGRWRLLRSLVTETILLGVGAAVLALPIAWVAGGLLRSLLFPDVSWAENPLDGPVLLMAVGTALVAATIVGFLPALSAARLDVHSALRSGSASRARTSGRLHTVLATGQVTLAVTLLLSAGLLMASFGAMRSTDLGFDADRVLAVTVASATPGVLDAGSEEEDRAYEEARSRVDRLPEVEATALTIGAPFLTGFSTALRVPGHDSIPALPGGGPWYHAVSTGWFETMGTDLLRGRVIEAADRDRPVVVISRSMAETLWPSADPLGTCIGIGPPDRGCHTVVGVVEDVHRVGYREPPSMQFYVPIEQVSGFRGTTLLVRLRPGAEARSVREAALATGGGVDLVEVRALSTWLEPEVRPWRLASGTLGVAAALATLVALMGVYGVLSYLVAQRDREISVRMALGASNASIGRDVLRKGLGTALGGIGLGVVLLVPVLRWIEPLLYKTSALDPVVVGGVAGVILVTTLVACLIPARQAVRVPPAQALQGE